MTRNDRRFRDECFPDQIMSAVLLLLALLVVLIVTVVGIVTQELTA